MAYPYVRKLALAQRYGNRWRRNTKLRRNARIVKSFTSGRGMKFTKSKSPTYVRCYNRGYNKYAGSMFQKRKAYAAKKNFFTKWKTANKASRFKRSPLTKWVRQYR